MADLNCPHCAARLRNVEAGPDGFARCLNCGKRFRHAANLPPAGGLTAAEPPATAPLSPSAQDTAASADTAAVAAEPVTGREPPAASYGLVVGLGYLVLIAAGLGGAALLVSMIAALAFTGSGGRFGPPLSVFAALLVTACALPLAGFVFLMLTCQLAKLDRAALRVAWLAGAVREAPPLPPGSNLPYILPLTVCGGALIVVPAIAVGAETESVLTGFFALPYGAGLMLAGLSLGELRRFFWRLEWLGQALARAGQGASPAARVGPVAPSFAPLLMLLAIACSALCLLLVILQTTLRPGPELAFTVCFGLLGVGGYVALHLLSRHAARAVGAWDHAFRLSAHVRERRPSAPSPDGFAVLLAGFACVWGSGLLLAFLAEVRPIRGPEYLAALCAVLSGAATAAWLGALLTLLSRGAKTAEALAPRSAYSQLSLRPLRESLGLPDGWIGTCLFVLLGLILLILALTVLAIAGEHEWGLMLLICTAPMYLGAWLAMATAFAVRAVRALTRADQRSKAWKDA